MKTDRVPDPEFAQCLNGLRVDYRRLSSATKATVDDQIGSEEACREFFEVFEFKHSMERYDDYEESLRSELEHDTDKNGWASFRQEVRHWAMRKNAPRPDGKIRHFHLLDVFAPDRPVALRQDFAVPPSYRVPDDAFHQEFIVEATTADGVAVLWGPPGRGKSTYLSHCVSELAGQDNVVCIRHHYFLRLDERGRRAIQLLRHRAVPRQAAGGRGPTGRSAENGPCERTGGSCVRSASERSPTRSRRRRSRPRVRATSKISCKWSCCSTRCCHSPKAYDFWSVPSEWKTGTCLEAVESAAKGPMDGIADDVRHGGSGVADVARGRRPPSRGGEPSEDDMKKS